MSPQFWWYMARSTGIVAWVLSIASVLWGLALATRALGDRPRAPWLLDLHRHLGGLTVLFVGAHIGALVADNYTHFGAADLLVPFASSWKPGAVALGVIAFYFLLAVEVSSLFMRRLPKKLWHAIHLTSFLVAVGGTAHFLAAGTDAGPAAWIAGLVALFSIGFFLLYRELAPKKRARPRSSLRVGHEDRARPALNHVGRDAAVRETAERRARVGSECDH